MAYTKTTFQDLPATTTPVIAAELNKIGDGIEDVHDFMGAAQAAWTAFTPTWTATTTNPAIGNGTLTGYYMQVGKTVHYRIYLLTGSTTTYGSGNYRWALPATANATSIAVYFPFGTGVVFDTSAGTRVPRWALYAGSSTVMLGDTSAAQVSNTVPMTFASGDEVYIAGTYEAA